MGVQVEQLTSGKSPWEKEFIDFSFNNKHISEFGLVAVSDGDRLTLDMSPPFTDEVSEVNGLNGQYFWGTKFQAKPIVYNLATDGMTEEQLNAFKHFFRPGQYGKFEEDAWYGRYTYCRVSEVTTLTMIPFQTNVVIAGRTIKGNVYKGEMKLTFVQDLPYFFSDVNYVTDSSSEADLRRVYHSGVPLPSSWSGVDKCCIGDSQYLLSSTGLSSGIEYSNVNGFPFYCPSTESTQIKLTLGFSRATTAIPSDQVSPIYFKEINSANTNSVKVKTTNGTMVNEMYYTAPNVIYSTNRAIEIISSFARTSTTLAALDLEEQLRVEITHPKVIAWAMAALRILKTHTELYNAQTGQFYTGQVTTYTPLGTLSASWSRFFNLMMLCMFATPLTTNPDIGTSGTYGSFRNYSIIFDGITNTCYTIYDYNVISDTVVLVENFQENCGDTMLSEYLTLKGGNTLTQEGKIASYSMINFLNNGVAAAVSSAAMEYKYTYL